MKKFMLLYCLLPLQMPSLKPALLWTDSVPRGFHVNRNE